MTTPEIGTRYQRRNIVLSKGNDWVATFVPRDEAGNPLPSFGWPDGTTARIVLGPLEDPLLTVAGVVSAGEVRFRIESTEADLIPADTEVRGRVQYPTTPTTELPWWKGKVKRDD